MTKKLASLLFVMSTCAFAQSEVIVTDSTSKSSVTSSSNSVSETTVKSPPASAISPSMNILNNDVCTTGVSGAVQSQILGISAGRTVTDLNCERLKLSKTLFDMGMKVAAVATLCQDYRVFSAMMNAGTPCPIDGKIGQEAKEIWNQNLDRQPKSEKETTNDFWQKTSAVLGGLLIILLLL